MSEPDQNDEDKGFPGAMVAAQAGGKAAGTPGRMSLRLKSRLRRWLG